MVSLTNLLCAEEEINFFCLIFLNYHLSRNCVFSCDIANSISLNSAIIWKGTEFALLQLVAERG